MKREIEVNCPLDGSKLGWNSAYKLFNCSAHYHQVHITIQKKTGHVLIEAN